MWIKLVFLASAIYDMLIGLAFLLWGASLFARTGVTPPNHWGYIQFPALLLILFALMFQQIAADPARRRDMIPYGMGLKASYCAVVFWNQFHGGVPALWLPFAWTDLAFLLLFFAAYRSLRPR